MEQKRSHFINSLEHLITISGILAGFAISGLIALPGIEGSQYRKVISYFQGNFDMAFLVCFYALFFSSICFLGTIMIILVYKISNYFVPFNKLRRIHLISNMAFSFAVASLTIAVISFGIPTCIGVIGAFVVGLGMAMCFIWENMVPWQRKKREEQLSKES